MSTPPLKDFFASPALSLSLAGVFRNAEAIGEDEVEEGETESGGGCQRGSVDISSENTGPGRSEEDGEEKSPEEEDGEIDPNNKRKKRRKKYHRHTAEQIREMEALFRESPHPDEKQREQLSKHLGLAPRQVKFWFQNRRTQIKAIQERHENSLLKSEIDNLREENQRLRESIKNACCPSCSGSMASSEENGTITGERLLRIENMRLKSEIEKLQEMIGGKQPRRRTSSPSPSCSTAATTTMELESSRSCLDNHRGVLGPEKSRIAATAAAAMDELMKMATAGEPLWVRSVETGRDILNYDEYAREFARDDPNVDALDRRCEVEASRETGSVILDVSRLTRAFMDVNQWKDMFPGLVSKASIVDVISDGEPNGGVMQLIFAELQLLTPMVPAREVYFVRYCKQKSPEKWAVVDVSVDIDASINLRCRKRPSGCIIEDKANGHCKITWMEHVACQRIAIPSLFRPIISTGLAFGARHWMATLQQQCERQVFSMATNVPAKGTIGVSTTMGRKSVLSLAQRMTCGFCRVVGATSNHVGRKKIPVKSGADDTRIFSRKNLNDPGEPIGVILCAASSVWLPVSPHDLFGFLTDDSRRKEWDIMFNGTPTDTVAYLAKGQDRGNSITIHGMGSDEKGKVWLLQDRCTNGFESTVVFAPADVNNMKSAIAGCDSGKISILPSGFSILPDGMETRPQVIRSRKEGRNMEGGSLLTFAVQILADSLPLAEVTMEAVDTTCSLVSCILSNVKRAMQCEDGS